jgi:hypothetical protein
MPARRPTKIQMVRGSLFTLRRKCGKPTCRCASGDPHETPALAYPEAGRTKTLTLTGIDLREVQAALARYEKAKAELDRAGDAGVAALRARVPARPRTQP